MPITSTPTGKRNIVVGRDLDRTVQKTQKTLQPAFASTGGLIQTHGGVALTRAGSVIGDTVLVPEYPGAVVCYLSASPPIGTLRGAFDTESCHNAYRWKSDESSKQTVNVVVRCLHTLASKRYFYARVTDGSSCAVALTHIGDTNDVLHQLGSPVECTELVWTKKDFVLPDGTYTPGKLITLVFALTASNGEEAYLGEVYIKK